jgi:hypothetical protein
MTDINSLPISNELNGDDELVNKILTDLNTNENPNELEPTMNSSDEILDELSDAVSDEENYEEYEYEGEGGVDNDLTKKIIREAKLPIIISVIAFLVNSSFMEEFILNIPFFGGDGQLNVFGIIFKALLIGGIFYFINKYAL